MTTLDLRPPGLRDDAAAQPAAHAALPVVTALLGRHPARLPAAVRVRLRRHARRRPRPASSAAATSTSTTSRPGILLMAVAGAAQATAISVAMDMTEGIIARFRTMAIARVSVLTGHVVGQPDPDDVALAVVIGVALLLGFGPTREPARLARGVRPARPDVTFALTWLSVALGLVTKSVETASNLPMPLLLLPFLGSGFVPTDSMPAGLRWFAEHQPFTPIMETLRGLLMGTADRRQRRPRRRLVRRDRAWAATCGRSACSTAIPSPSRAIPRPGPLARGARRAPRAAVPRSGRG